MSYVCKYFHVLVITSLIITNNVSNFHQRICMNIFAIYSIFFHHKYFLMIWLGALLIHLLHMILRFLSPTSGLSTNPNASHASWSFSLSMVYFVLTLRRGRDRRPLCILMDIVILEGINYGISKFVQGYGNLCHYSNKNSMLFCGHAWKMSSS